MRVFFSLEHDIFLKSGDERLDDFKSFLYQNNPSFLLEEGGGN